MRSRLRHVVAIAAGAGVLGGAVAAIAIPSTERRAEPPPRVGAAPKPHPYEVALEPVAGSVRVELRVDDPDGGPGWAIRTFRARPVERGAQQWCAQLLRVHRGRLGWIDGTNTFRPAVFSQSAAPTHCAPRAPGPGRGRVRAETLLRGTDTEATAPHATAIWGWGGGSLKSVEVKLPGGAERPRPSPGGAFLVLADDPVYEARFARTTLSWSGGPSRAVAPEGLLGAGRSSPFLRGTQPRDVPAVVEARTPDPNGGPPWAVGVVPAAGGGFCLTQPERAVDGRLGRVDFAQGTFYLSNALAMECRGPEDARMRKRPLAVVYQLGGGVAEPGRESATGRTARRTLPGATVVFGHARADVREVTIRTPRGIQTLAPSGPHHVLLAVYDGGFPTGSIVLTAHFADGSSRVVERFDVSGI
jgi:hypothetical protein